MDEEAVFVRFLQMTGLTPEQGKDWAFVCKDAVSQMKSGMKPNIDVTAYSQELCATAATLAFYKYAMILDVTENDSICAGEIKLSRKSGVSSAKQLWNEAKVSCAAILNDSQFVFEQVKI